MSRAVGTHVCRPAALGEAIIVVRLLHSIADPSYYIFRGTFLDSVGAIGPLDCMAEKPFTSANVSQAPQKRCT
ncbi:hypothetical protein EVAR_81388_1 [Eumeta japonica]|uniref:Uncharacterized protein n=1 Tax=Eumeta variegata TaxID=151549 RepID=A0A4C1WHC9_EUMVA|nr:hypothetical protein EVAR_81388_1 [Eumeta japonica]